ncbi:hypothetical protein JCM8547_007954 [Rhodosporidiobolus lusitaniae]
MSWRNSREQSRAPFFCLVAGGTAIVFLTLYYLFSPTSTTFGTVQAAASSQVSRLSTGTSELVVDADATTSSTTCSVNRTLVETYGEHNIRRSRVHEGTGWRVQRFLAKLEKGERLKVGVIGGSVSNGHGTLNGHRYQYHAIEHIWHSFVSSWLNETYCPMELLNGAKSATDASFMSFCWTELLALEKEAPSLVLIELDVNDQNDEVSRNYTESIVRKILALPNQPAVIFVGSFALTSQSGTGGMTNGGDAHAALSAFYDLPQISLRGPLLPALLRNASLAMPFFNDDPRHIAAPLHRFLGDMVVAYLEEQRCASLSRDEAGQSVFSSELWPGLETLGELPPRLLTDDWDSTVVHPVAAPFCRIAGLSLSPVRQDPSWNVWSWKSTKTYLRTGLANQTVEFDVSVPEGGEGVVGVGFMRSNSPAYKLGFLHCQVGEQETTLDGWWDRDASLVETQIVTRDLPAGLHRLVCTTGVGRRSDWTAFRLASVVAA